MNTPAILDILRCVQDGECTVARGMECIELASAGNFHQDLLPPSSGYFGEDEIPVETVKALRAVNAELLAAAKGYYEVSRFTTHGIEAAKRLEAAITHAEKP